MKWERADLGVGVAVVGAVVVLTGTLLWLSPAVSRDTYTLETEFTQIGGIAEQNPVYLRGYQVGRIADIEPHMGGDSTLSFVVRLNIRSSVGSGDSLLLPVGTIARLIPALPVGAGSITLVLPSDGGARGWLQPGARIPGIRDTPLIDQVQATANSVTAELVETLAIARGLMATLEETAGTASGILVNTAEGVPDLLLEVRRELVLAQQLTREMRQHMETLVPTTVATIDSTRALLAESRSLLRRFDATLTEQTPAITAILANLDTTTLLLEHVSRQIADRPLSVLFGWRPPQGLIREPTPPAAQATPPAAQPTPPDSGGHVPD